MPAAIKDDLLYAPMSRQRKWQIRKERRSLCHICGKPTFTKYYEAPREYRQLRLCDKHLDMRRAMNLKKYHDKKASK